MTTPAPNNGSVAIQKRPQSPEAKFRDTLTRMRDQIQLALPKGFEAERLMRIVLTVVKRTPQLLQCTETSVLGAIMQAAQLGLEPDNVLGLAYLLPYGNQCQLIIGYKGLIELARRSGVVATIRAEVVHRHDYFHYELGLSPTLRHIPSEMLEFAPPEVAEQIRRRAALDTLDKGKVPPNDLIAAYAVVKFKDGTDDQFRVVTRQFVDKVRNMSRSSSSANSPWNQWAEAMWMKTAIKQVLKYVPLSPEDRTAIERADNRVISGVSPIGQILAVDDKGREEPIDVAGAEAETTVYDGELPLEASALDQFVQAQGGSVAPTQPAGVTPPVTAAAPVPAPAAEAPKKRGRPAKAKPDSADATAVPNHIDADVAAATAQMAGDHDPPPAQQSLFDDAD